MNLPLLLVIGATLVFGITSIILDIQNSRQKKILLEEDKKNKQRLYEITILKQIQDRIGYELDIERVVQVIIGSVAQLLSYSTVSSLIRQNEKTDFKYYQQEQVSTLYVQHLQQTMENALVELEGNRIVKTLDTMQGLAIEKSLESPIGSLFTIPLVVDEVVVGLITIASTKKQAFRVEEMTLLYQITNQASLALSRLQEVLITEKGKLMSGISSLSDGVFMVDMNNNLLVINDSAKKLLGIKKDNPTIIDVFSSLSRSYDFVTKLDMATTKRESYEEKEVPLGDRVVHLIINPVTDSHTHRVMGASVLLQDITLEKNLSQMKEDFTNIIIHELRAPLTAIRGASQVMAMGGISEDEKKKFLDIIHEQSIWLIEEVSTLLDVGKMEAGRFTVLQVPTDFTKLARDRFDFFKLQADTKQVKIGVHIDDNFPLLNIDPLRINQVLNNLLSNSLKFTPEGGMITLRAQNPTLLQKHVTISVTDTGIGIPKEKQGQLFSKFSQVVSNVLGQKDNQQAMQTTAAKREPGTGLGLYVIKGIVEAHGGAVSLVSAPGQGTTISFTLPVASAQTTSPMTTTNPTPPSHIFKTAVN